MKEIYIGSNNDRSKFVDEIDVLKLVLHGEAPQISNLSKVESDIDEFHYDFDLSARSAIEIMIKTVITVNLTESNNYRIPLSCNIIIKSINGRVRLYYTNKNDSSFALIGSPAVKLNIEPVLGDESQIEVKNYPRIKEFIEELIMKEFDDFCLPNKKKINIPATIKDDICWPIRKAEKTTQSDF